MLKGFKFGFVITLFSIVFAAPAFVNAKQIVLYHTSDIHGFFFPREDVNGRIYGGFAALEAVLKKEKNPFILLDSGDWSSGNKEANDTNGLHSVRLLNKAGKSKYNVRKQGYSALTVGNHDTDFGRVKLGQTLSAFNGDIVAFNIADFTLPKKEIKPYAVYEVDGAKIAVIGWALDGPGWGERFKPTSAEDFRQVMRQVLTEKPDVIVLLAHDSISDSRKPSSIYDVLISVPEAKENIDVFLGGHAHSLNIEQKFDNPGILFVESGSMLAGVSKIVLDLEEETNRLRASSAQYIPLDVSTVGEDKKMKKYLDKIEDKSLQNIYAYVPQRITKYPNGPDSAAELPKMMADQMFKWLSAREKVDFALFTIPAVRKDIAAGDMTGRDLVEIFPYTEYVASFSITGKELKEAIAGSIKRDKEHGDYSLISYSYQIRVTYRYTDKGVELVSTTLNGNELVDEYVYRGGAITHLPDGYYEGVVFKGLKSPNKRVYTAQSTPGLLFDLVKHMPQNEEGIKMFTAPRDIRIQRLP